MKIEAIKLPKTERFVCSKTAIKESFGYTALDRVSFGRYQKTFHSEGRGATRPKIEGKVVASLTITRLGTSLSLFPIRYGDYNDNASLDFTTNILPQMQHWFESEKKSNHKPIRVSFIVEWFNEIHHIHKGHYY